MKIKHNHALPCPPIKTTSASKFMLGSLAAAAVLPLAARADEPAAPPPPSRVHALVAVQFANEYLTPRGMIVRDDGLTVQPLLLGFVNVYKGDSFINDVTLVPGAWNDLGTTAVSVHAPYGSTPKTPWSEIDPIMGVSVGFAKHFTLDVTYTAFVEHILDIGTSQHLDTKLSFDDSPFLKAFALHPYIEYWQELDKKATAADVPYLVDPLGKGAGSGPGSSYYFEVGIAPAYTFEKIGLKVELPCRVLLPDKNFYGTYYSGASTVGLYEVGIKGSVPLNFIPPGYGHWNFSLGFRYQGFVDENLKDMQQFNAPGKSVDGSAQVYCGVSMFF